MPGTMSHGAARLSPLSLGLGDNPRVRVEAIVTGRLTGSAWGLRARAARSALLIVPSLPARIERNILINPAHPEAAAIRHDLPQPVWWDERLFQP